jgi:hypothetical protein
VVSHGAYDESVNVNPSASYAPKKAHSASQYTEVRASASKD